MLEKIESKLDIKKLVKILLISFIIAQPILDIYMSLFDEKIQIVGVSLATIVRFLWVFVMTILTIIYARKNKNTKAFIIYGVVVLIYTILHHFNAKGFTVKLSEAKYSASGEIFYIARMCIPAALIYIIYNIKLNYKDIKTMIVSVSLIISVSLLLTNLFKVSFISYSLDQEHIAGNIIEWFTKGISEENEAWVQYSARGWFKSSNQLSGLTVILVPILTFIALKENKIKYWVVIVLHIMAMICLTTRVGALAGILVMGATIFIFILEKAIHKEYSTKLFTNKSFYCVICSSIIIAIFFNNSPFKVRIDTGDLGYDSLSLGSYEQDNTNTTDIEPSDLEKIKYFEENEEEENIDPYFSHQVYPYTEDIDFWYNLLMNVPRYERQGNRKLKTLLMNRIIERDNRFSNQILGISFTTSSSFVWPERDFETQLYSLGFGGCILFIGPYIAVLLFGVLEFFKHFKENLYLSKVVYMFSICIGFIAGYSSGHIINELFPFVFLAVVTGISLNVSAGDTLEENKEFKGDM